MNLKYELQSIISGTGKNSTENLIESATHHFGKSKEAGGNAQAIEYTKEQEATKLSGWIDTSGLWFNDFDKNLFYSKRGRSEVARFELITSA